MDEFTSLHHTLLTLLPPQSLCGFLSLRFPWIEALSGTGPAYCPLALLFTGIVIFWIVVHAYSSLFIIHGMCLCNSVNAVHSVHRTSIVLSILERDPPLLLS